MKYSRIWARPLVPVAVVGLAGLAITLFLGWQNLRLRGDLVRAERNFESLEETLAWNLQLSALEGGSLPTALAEALEPRIPPAQDLQATRLLLVVYTPTVCTSCLRAGFHSLRTSYSSLQAKGIHPHAVIGERPGVRESALLLREENLLDFPMTFVPNNEVLNAFPWTANPHFTDTPIYLLLNQDLTVQSVYRADQKRAALFDAWLTALPPGPSYPATAK